MKTLFLAEAVSKGGSEGSVQSPDRLLDIPLGNPLEEGTEPRGPTPELLFAGAYSAFSQSALSSAAKRLGLSIDDSTVRAIVRLIEDDRGGHRLAVELHTLFPGLDHLQVQRIMDEAHKTFPYSQVPRGDTSVRWRRINRSSRHAGSENTEAVTLVRYTSKF